MLSLIHISTAGPTPVPTPKPVPDMPEDSELSQELLSLDPSAVEWNKKGENPEDQGLYFISKENVDHAVYNVDLSLIHIFTVESLRVPGEG